MKILESIKWWVWLHFTRDGREMHQFIALNGIPSAYSELLEWERGGAMSVPFSLFGKARAKPSKLDKEVDELLRSIYCAADDAGENNCPKCAFIKTRIEEFLTSSDGGEPR